MQNEAVQLEQYENDLVSVVMPVYNAETFLRQAIDSVLAQTYQNIELIIIDDCSEDNSAAIIADYTHHHECIKYHRQPRNMGVGAARNLAMQLACGRYVAFLDADDVWKSEKTTKQLSVMHKHNAPLSYTAIEMIDVNGDLLKRKRSIKETVDYRFLLRNTIMATSSVIVDRHKVGDFQMPLRRSGQDYATWLMLLRNGAVAVGVDEALVQYRVHSGSLSSRKFQSVKQVWEIQTKNEGIGRIAAAWNTAFIGFNALKKYLF